MRAEAERAHHDLIDQLVARGALWSGLLQTAFRTTPRQFFLDQVYCHEHGSWVEVATVDPTGEALKLVYSDRALTTCLGGPTARQGVPISSSSQPSLMAQMLEDLQLRPGLRVLEIGAGTGYNAALLSRVVGPITSIDVDRRVLETARRHLAHFPDRQVELHHADGRAGYPPGAPYDRILVAAATLDLEPAWLEQLASDGLILAPLDLGPNLSFLVRGTVLDEEDGLVFEGRLTRPAYFMPLRNEDETGREEQKGNASPIPAADRLGSVPAPWAHWPDRRSGRDFLPCVAFLGWLEGLTLSQGTMPDGRPGFAVADLVEGNACWMSQHEWRVSGKDGQALGERLWQTFLDTGGPAPTEFWLRARPIGKELEGRGGILSYRRQGPNCEQVWELPEVRERAGEE